MMEPRPRNGGQILVDALVGHGVDTAFGVPGESFLVTLDALYDARNSLRLVTCRHEAGAANMAEAYGKLTGRPGICFVTRGPGACHAAIGLHTGFQDSTPMILFVGDIDRGHTEREAFQAMDYKQMFAAMGKWVATIDDAARIPELVSQAFHVAMSGRPGPVVLSLPEDMQRDTVRVADAPHYQIIRPAPDAAAMADLQSRLDAAQRPVLMVGGSGWTADGAAHIRAFAEAFDLPVVASFRCQDIVDNESEAYVGDLGIAVNRRLVEHVKQADLLLVVGARLGELTTQGYDVVAIPDPQQTLVHVYAEPGELGRVYRPDLAVVSGMDAFAAAAQELKPPADPAWRDWRRELRRSYLDHLGTGASPGAVDMIAVMRSVDEMLPENAIVTNDAGNNSAWLQRYHRYRTYRSQLGPTSGAMGYGVPAAVAAALQAPERRTVCFVGDGGFMMSGQEIATALQHGAAPVIVIVNNGTYGTIRMHQERDYPGRTIGTDLKNPDFVAYAASFGAHAERVERTAEFAPAFERALAAGRCAVVEVRLDADTISPTTTLSALQDSD